MTKQKVWFEKKPEFRDECPFFVYGEHLHYCSLKKVNIFDDKDKCSYCPLQTIKQHDRELVKKVCEKIRSELEKELKYDFTSYVPIMNVCNKINRVLDQTQKEYEK